MTASRRVIKFTIGTRICRSWSRLRGRARSLWAGSSARGCSAYRKEPIFLSVGQALACIIRRSNATSSEQRPRVAGGARRACRPGKEPTITVEAKTWVVRLACRKAKELGYPHEVWTTRLLAAMPASMDRLRGIRA